MPPGVDLGAIAIEVATEREFTRDRIQAPLLKGHAKAKEGLESKLRDLAREGDIAKILEVERLFLKGELETVATASETVASLMQAITELDAAEATWAKLSGDPDAYRVLDKDLSLQKNRVGNLPRDQARQFFDSHLTRLGNLKKGRLDEGEERELNHRIYALKVAKGLYTERHTRPWESSKRARPGPQATEGNRQTPTNPTVLQTRESIRRIPWRQSNGDAEGGVVVAGCRSVCCQRCAAAVNVIAIRKLE